MELHKNACLTPKGRARLMHRIYLVGLPAAARELGISERRAHIHRMARIIQQRPELSRRQPARRTRQVRQHQDFAEGGVGHLWGLFLSIILHYLGHFLHSDNSGGQIKVVLLEDNKKYAQLRGIQRTVKENCSVLKFDSSEFEGTD
jgi:hypothetical protein